MFVALVIEFSRAAKKNGQNEAIGGLLSVDKDGMKGEKWNVFVSFELGDKSSTARQSIFSSRQAFPTAKTSNSYLNICSTQLPLIAHLRALQEEAKNMCARLINPDRLLRLHQIRLLNCARVFRWTARLCWCIQMTARGTQKVFGWSYERRCDCLINDCEIRREVETRGKLCRIENALYDD